MAAKEIAEETFALSFTFSLKEMDDLACAAGFDDFMDAWIELSTDPDKPDNWVELKSADEVGRQIVKNIVNHLRHGQSLRKTL